MRVCDCCTCRHGLEHALLYIFIRILQVMARLQLIKSGLIVQKMLWFSSCLTRAR